MAEGSSGIPSPTDAPNKEQNRRTVLGTAVNPAKQIRYAFLFVGGGMLMLTVFIAATIYYIRETVVAFELAYRLDHEVTAALMDSLTGMLTLAFMVAAVFSILSIVLGWQMSHRFYGPVIPLLRHIEELRNGNFSSRVKLRRGDELMELQEALNGLAEMLEAKSGEKRA